MQKDWKKSLLRHGLFTYARDSLIFFVNLFLWSQVKDLQVSALFNIVYLSAHTSMFFVCIPIMKRGRSQSLMRAGVFILALTLGVIVLLRKDVVTYAYWIAVSTGIGNGMYWLVNHVESLDVSSNKNRTSFLSYRNASQGAAKLAVPGVGWLAFTILPHDSWGYIAVFGLSMVAMLIVWLLVDIPMHAEEKLDIKGSLAEFRRTKHFWQQLANGFLYGVTLRSALPTVLLPFLIFQVVTKESSLSIVQTAIEATALVATFYFAGHKKNTEYISKLFWLSVVTGLIGLSGLFWHLSMATYLLYVITFVLSLSAMNIANGTMSTNFITTVRNYKKHRIEFIAVRELVAISGFAAGYIFMYFHEDLDVSSIRPLVAVSMVGMVLSLISSVTLWKYVQRVHAKPAGEELGIE